MSGFDPDVLRESAEQAEEQAMELLKAMAEVIAPDGVAYDQQEFKSDAEFVGFVIDLQNRPSPDFSVWKFLPTVSPKLYEEMVTRYQQATAKLIGARS